jgi:N-acetylglucosamine malate deacetylase 1
MTIVAVGAHPDDLELLCAGTLAKGAQRGDQVHMVVLARGDQGSATHRRDEIAAIRHEEAKRSAAIIGATLHWMGGDDVDIAFLPELREKLIALVRELQPDLLLAHSPEDYMLDHQHAGALADEAAFAATVPHYRTVQAGAPFPLPAVFLMDTINGLDCQPTEYVDISDVFEIKRQMLACHESQNAWIKAHDQTDLLEMMEAHARFRGMLCGVRQAEGFRPLLRWGRVRTSRLLP